MEGAGGRGHTLVTTYYMYILHITHTYVHMYILLHVTCFVIGRGGGGRAEESGGGKNLHVDRV